MHVVNYPAFRGDNSIRSDVSPLICGLENVHERLMKHLNFSIGDACRESRNKPSTLRCCDCKQKLQFHNLLEAQTPTTSFGDEFFSSLVFKVDEKHVLHC